MPRHLRRQGIGSRLLDGAEQRIAERSPLAGIGVGLSADYGAAQRLYVQRGYIPDGRGACQGQRPLRKGTRVSMDDDLIIWLTKDLAS